MILRRQTLIILALVGLSFRGHADPLASRTCNQVFSQTQSRESSFSQSAKDRLSEQSKNHRQVRLNWFTVSRGLQDYASEFSIRNTDNSLEKFDFLERVNGLQGSQRWLDSGAGNANAQADLVSSSQSSALPELVAVAVQRPLISRFTLPKAIRYLSGRKLEAISDTELGRFDLVTDLYGPVSYSTEPIEVVNKYLRLTKRGSTILVALHFANTVFVAGDGTTIGLSRWIQRELEATRAFRVTVFHGGNLKIEVLTDESIQLPSLELKMFKAGSPPARAWVDGRDPAKK